MNIESQKKTGLSTVGNVQIKYTINYDKDGNVKELLGYAYKDTEIIGSMNANATNGVFGCSMNEGNGLTASERKAVVDQMLDDISETFDSKTNG